ncbi:hypothetical protein V1514DRAFT_326099 [Lipomyces japonicus]|uniref:uncharacterized protein n=1 Tax=Lipomyces japonicus TaxID=56871 RepID=UPI0034CECC4B
MATKTCTHKGCGKQFSSSDESECNYHPGPPIFHDALKGWSCCKKRVISFDEFLNIPGCTTGVHSTEVPDPAPAAKKPDTKLIPTSINADGSEVYGSTTSNNSTLAAVSNTAPTLSSPPQATTPTSKKSPEPNPAPAQLEDPIDADIPNGKKCKRNGCSFKFDGTTKDNCVHHPGTAVFHDASKGWSCCKRRVLEFDEFLKIPGCKTGNHLFLGPPEAASSSSSSAAAITTNGNAIKQDNELVECRTDFYQTPTTVIVSVFAKKTEEEKSKVEFSQDSLALDLIHLGTKRFKTEFKLYGPIIPEQSKFKVMGTKVELTLKKANGLSWAGLRAGETGAGMIRFGVSGRTGTIGGKEIIYRNQS